MSRPRTARAAMFGLGLCVGLAGSGIAAHLAGRWGYDAGRLAAYRETDRVLRDLERALAPIAASRHGAAPATLDDGDAP